MDNVKTEQDIQKKSADVFLELAGEAEVMMKVTSESARNEALEATQKFLEEYEEAARKIILKTRESARAQAAEIAEHFNRSLMEHIMKTSVSAMSQIVAGIGPRTQEMTQRLQKPSANQAYRALVDALKEKPTDKYLEAAEELPEIQGAANPESFRSWLTQ